MPQPRVSIITPAYNATATLARTVQSVQAQTLTDWEMLIVNDGSTDGTRDMIAGFAAADPRITLLDMPQNQGQSAARNAGLAAARGTWLAIWDADDAYTPERLQTLVDFAETHAMDMVADNQLFYDAAFGAVSRQAMPSFVGFKDWTLLTHLTHEKVGELFKWGLLKPLMKRTFWQASGVVYRTPFRMGEDSLFVMELLARGAKAAVVPQAMYVYTTSIGDRSGKASGFSTSRYKLADHMATYTYLREHYPLVRDTPALARALATCERRALQSDASITFKQHLARKNLIGALKTLMVTPGLLFFLAHAVRKRVLFRLLPALGMNR